MNGRVSSKSDIERAPTGAGIGGEFDSRYRPLSAYEARLELPPDVVNRESFGRWFMVELPEVMGEVYRAFEVGISKVTSLEADRLEGIKGAFRLAVDELLVNSTFYGLAGMTSKQRVEAYIEVKEDLALTAAIDERLQDREVRERRGSIAVDVFPDRAVLTVCDGTPFSDFRERWEGANDALLEENLERLSGRGFLLLRSYGFSAEQTAAGAVVYTLKFAE